VATGPCRVSIERVVTSTAGAQRQNIILLAPMAMRAYDFRFGQRLVALLQSRERPPKFAGVFAVWPFPRVSPKTARVQVKGSPMLEQLKEGFVLEVRPLQRLPFPARSITLSHMTDAKVSNDDASRGYFARRSVRLHVQRLLKGCVVTRGSTLTLSLPSSDRAGRVLRVTRITPGGGQNNTDKNISAASAAGPLSAPATPTPSRQQGHTPQREGKKGQWELFSVSDDTHLTIQEDRRTPAPSAEIDQRVNKGQATSDESEDAGRRTSNANTSSSSPSSPSPASSAPSPLATSTMRPRFADIGGLSREIKLIREVVEAPLHSPTLFSEIGLKPPKGVLLYGPPGTGKTMLARAIAAQTEAAFFSVNSPEIVGRFVGDAEEKLSTVFKTANERAPSIIFFDEIDAICPNRDKASAASQRIVACLLTLLDGTASDSRVVIIAATNRPNSLDPALRRPGRFDREVEIGIPNEKGRADILRKMLKKMPHDLTESDILHCAGVSHGYVGADLRALAQEAAFSALRRLRSTPDPSAPARGTPAAAALKISLGDFKRAFAAVQPSAMREVSIDVPKVGWKDVGGQVKAKKELKEAVEWPLAHPEAFQRMGVRPPKGVLLYGPPGCSKTLMAKALANESSRNFLAVKGPELFRMYVGESERAVRSLFSKARAAAPAIVFFDEIDALAASRGGGGGGEGNRAADRVLGQLLSELDGMHALNQVVVIAATNRPDLIDPAMLRPGRIDRMVYVGPPDAKSRAEIARIQLRKMAHAPEVTPGFISERTEGFSGAEVVAVCQRAATQAMEEDVTAERVEQRHFDLALGSFKPGITEEMVRWYEAYENHTAATGVDNNEGKSL